jgi:flagellar hook-basal body complex protein FliE
VQIDSVSGIASAANRLSIGSAQKTSGSANFADLLSDAMNQAADADAADVQSTNAVLSGQDESLDATMIAAQKAELTLDLAIQIRNKVIQAYEEIIKMQI